MSREIGIDERPELSKWIILSLQHMFAMFGATILVPKLVGLSPAIALLTSGIATIIFIAVTRFQVPAYLGSSFAFIAPIMLATSTGGVGSAMIGAMFVSLVYAITALVIWKTGHAWFMKILPPVVVGPVIMVIGLALAPVAVDMAMNIDTNGDGARDTYSMLHFSAALVTLTTAIVVQLLFRGLLALMPIISGIIVGYLYSLAIGIVDFSAVREANFLQVPDILLPGVDYPFVITTQLLLIMVPISIVTISEHIGHQLVLGKIVDRNYIENPGLHRSLLGDGLGTFFSALIGGPPKTTYGENIGVLALTRVFSVAVILLAAVFAIIFSFFGQLMAMIDTIPAAVLGAFRFCCLGSSLHPVCVC